MPVMEEVLEGNVGQDYFNYLHYRLARYFHQMDNAPAGRR
jgi:hypothetical protein